MVGSLREFTIGVFASLFATFLTTYAINFIQLGNAFNFKEFLDIVINYTFLMYWILLLVFMIILRWFVRNSINKLQTPPPMVFGVGNNYDLQIEGEGYGFKWRIYANDIRKDPFTDEIQDIKVGRIDGPYCKNDYRKMKVSRTYFGRYKYKCPKCGYKRVLLKNTWTLESEVEDDIEATYRNKTNI